jgi:hypothetical protein
LPKRSPVPVGRPRTEPTEADVKQIELWAREGLPIVQMARGLGVAVDTMKRWRTDHPLVDEALEAGREQLHHVLRSKLIEKALAGDTVSLLFALKCMFGWREGDRAETGNRVSITFNLPGAKKPEQFTVESQ